MKAWNRLGLIPKEDMEKILKNAKFDVKRIEEIEKETKHDVIAFLTSVAESLGPESRWVHYGMTSSDTIDTAVALQMRDSLKLIIEDVKMVMESIKKRAYEHKMTLMVGRSHGIHGEPITFGLVLAIWYDEFARHLKNLEETLEVISVGKVSGAMGNFAHAPMELEEYVCEELGLKPIFEAQDFVLYDKPSGVMVHPRNRRSEYTLIDEIKWAYGMGANIVHRIDKETSGLILAAKYKEAEKELKRLFETKQIQKRYLALVYGELKDDEMLIDAPIAINRDFSQIKLKMRISSEGKPAKTLVRPLQSIGPYTLVEATPFTGRQHQIRLHLFHVKHPIVGDPIYGRPTEDAIRYLDRLMDEDERIEKMGAPRLMLHAQELDFRYKGSRYRLFSRYDFVKECEKLLSQKKA